MGSAFSSDRGKGGSWCLFKIGRAVKVACIVLLLVVASGVAALHRTEARPPPLWIPVGAEAAAERTSGRKRNRKLLPRVRIPIRAEPAVERRRELRRNRRLLPRGLAHDTSNLELEPSLAGDPEWRMKLQEAAAPAAPALKPKSLLAVPVGIKNKEVVDKLVSKFLAADFAVILFHYDGAVEQWGDTEWSERVLNVAAKGQTKWWFAKRCLHPDVIAEYEYVFVWDEDIEVDAFDPIRYLDVVRREGLEVSQPALDRRSEIHHAITARALQPTEDGVHRRVRDARCSGNEGAPPCVGWVEVMVPVFSRAAWRCAWRMMQNDLIHGWGLDYKLGYCTRGDRARSVGVVDSEYVLHRGVPMLSDSSKATPSVGRAAVRNRASKEMKLFNKRWEKAATEDKSWTDPYAAEGGDLRMTGRQRGRGAEQRRL